MTKLTKEQLAQAIAELLKPKPKKPDPFPWMAVLVMCAIATAIILANLPRNQPAPLPASGMVGNPR